MTVVMYVKNDIGTNFSKIPVQFRQKFSHEFKPWEVAPQAVVKLYNDKELTVTDLALCEFLFKVRFATINQILAYLSYKFPEKHFDEEKTLNRLSTLIKQRIVNNFILQAYELNADYSDALQIYCLDFGGKYLLNNYSDYNVANFFTADLMLSSKAIARSLYDTEFYLAVLRTLHKNDSDNLLKNYTVNPKFYIGRESFTLGASFDLLYNNHEQKSALVDFVMPDEEATYYREREKLTNNFIHSARWHFYFDTATKAPLYIIAYTNQSQVEFICRTLLNSSEFVTNELVLLDANTISQGYLDDKEKFEMARLDHEKGTIALAKISALRIFEDI